MEKVNLQIKVNPDKYRDFKIECLRNRQTISQAVNELLEYYIENQLNKNENDKKTD